MAHSKRNQTDPMDDLRKDFDALREDVTALAQFMKDRARLREQDLADRASQRVVALRDVGEDGLEEIRARATHAAKTAKRAVRENPTYAVAGVAALGFIVGALFARRR